ncbi:Sucraseferredoxin-like protein [Venustampulla echinocandica]|uniref:Altered inheritance of mitochondria protein 32 n=1 Tax=Venustampulla echinocandica TaxID=2656787 RepID=A0A370TJ87_9HELO|nr:Sucraseferredoxin-like protein [Venustampulla echinocandica]RDL35412.1 Sucraseferredoxin-like protein [Venustampulla echinocandica]
MSPYAEQVLICTGQGDWTSKIEEESSGDNLAADIKGLLGRGGIYADPYHNVTVLNSSFPPTGPRTTEIVNRSAYILPSFKYVPFIRHGSFDAVQALVKGYLLPTKLSFAHDHLSPIHRDRLLRKKEYTSMLDGVQDVKDVLVLICGHGTRDQRCGIMGPVLQGEFEKGLEMHNLRVKKDAVGIERPTYEEKRSLEEPKIEEQVGGAARVGLISHMGGHKFAGNVILYLPPGMKTVEGDEHPLGGCGIWYGRVEPKHVDGIVKETIQGGKVIEDLFRGGIRQNGEILRL